MVDWTGVHSPVIPDKNGVFPGRKTRYLLVVFLLACLQLALLSVETRAQVTCRIASLDYPPEVMGGRRFNLAVTVDHSFWTKHSLRVDVWEGVWDSSKRYWYFRDAVAGGEIVEVSGTGSRKFYLDLTAPSTSKEWSLTVIASYQAPYETSWTYLGAQGGAKSFSIVVYTRCQIWLKASPSEVARYAKMLGEGEYDADAMVALKVDRIVLGPSGTRYVFLFWTIDGRRYDTDAPTIRADRRQITATAQFKVQYELSVKSDFGNLQGSGWYDEGSTATFSVTSPVGFGIQYVFERWSGSLASTSPTSVIVMNSPKTVVAVWRTDYTVLIVMILGVVSVSVAAIGFIAYSRRRKAVGPAAPLGVVHPEAPPAGVPSKPVPETAAAVKEVREVPTPKIVPITEQAPPLDDRVYSYIVEHEGTIALSQAAKDLGISLDELNAAIGRLKSQGRLA